MGQPERQADVYRGQPGVDNGNLGPELAPQKYSLMETGTMSPETANPGMISSAANPYPILFRERPVYDA